MIVLLTGVTWYFITVFNFTSHFIAINDTAHLFKYLLAIWMSFDKWLFRSSAFFEVGFWVLMLPCMSYLHILGYWLIVISFTNVFSHWVLVFSFCWWVRHQMTATFGFYSLYLKSSVTVLFQNINIYNILKFHPLQLFKLMMKFFRCLRLVSTESILVSAYLKVCKVNIGCVWYENTCWRMDPKHWFFC